MSAVPVLKPREVVAILTELGFRHEDGRGTTVPFHKGRDIAPPLLRKIARDIGMTVEAFVEANQ